ncbi:MAG: hypothetical protein PF588_01165 [Candidatus Kapabacteria bacterium]|jgi:lipopolysaccharide export LptBFGC system permease protein LptF|nr:hypothetical protein [Candidatus Kapabacteria bacterium]
MKIYYTGRILLSSLIMLIVGTFSLSAQPEAEKFAENFVNAIKNENLSGVLTLAPNPRAIKIMWPEHAKGLTDIGIMEKFNINAKLTAAYNNILSSAEKSEVELEKIYFLSLRVESPWEDSKMPKSMTVRYEYCDTEGEFSIACIVIDEEYYLMDIMVSMDVFDVLEN